MPLPLTVSWVALGVALAVSAVLDVRTRRIPDGITLPLWAVGLVLRAWAEGLGGWGSGAVTSLAGAALGALAMAWSAWRGRLDWGDVKLMAAVGAVMGLPAMVTTTVCVALVGAVQAVVVLLWNGEAAATAAGLVRRSPGPGRAIPYGIAIALGTAWSMWWQYPPVALSR